MVAKQVINRRALLHGDSLCTGIDVLDQCAGAAGPLKEIADIDRGCTANRGLHPVAVAVVGKYNGR